MLFDTHLTEEFDALRDTVKRMCDAELAPRAAEIDTRIDIEQLVAAHIDIGIGFDAQHIQVEIDAQNLAAGQLRDGE